MTAEQFHDAISLLPGDLITEADRRRTARKSPVRWQRYAAMAACLALVVCGSLWCFSFLGMGGTKEAAAPAAMLQMAPEAPMEAAEAIPEAAADEAAPRSESAQKDALSTFADAAGKFSGAGNSNTACSATVPSALLRIEGQDYPLTEENQTSLATLLGQLEFRTEDVCECIAEITVISASTEQYHINLEEGFVRCSRGQAILTQEQIRLLKNMISALIS